MLLRSPAKINLALDVLDVDQETNYHLIKTVFQEISLADEIEFTMTSSDITLEVEYVESRKSKDVFKLFNAKNNSLLKAAHLLRNHVGVKCGVHLRIKKRIPPQTGLGGASSNAATVLLGLNALWGLDLEKVQLKALAKQIGMDVAFFLHGGTALGEHFGEQITPLPPLYHCFFLIIFPEIFVSTYEAYAKISNFKQIGSNAFKTDMLIKQLVDSSQTIDFSLLHNDFELLTAKTSQIYEHLYQKLYLKSARKVQLCGSGGAIFAIFDNVTERNRAYTGLESEFMWIEKAESVSGT